MVKIIGNFLLVLTLLLVLPSCSKSKVACPGSGQYKAGDLSLFDEDGKPVMKKSKKKSAKKNDFGLINKSQPSNLKRRQKKSLSDRPNK